MRCIWTWLLVEWRTFSSPKIRRCKLSNKVPNMSAWGPDCSCRVLVVCSSRVKGETVLVHIGVAESWPDGMEWVNWSLLGALKEWVLLAWRVIMDIGRGRGTIFPSVGGWTPSRCMIFMMRLQKGIHVHVTDRVAVFPMVWKMWAQMLIETPIMRSHRNCPLPRLMKAVLDNW